MAATPEPRQAAATLSLRILSQLPAPHGTIHLSAVPATDTVAQVKARLGDELPSRPAAVHQRLIYRGRALTRDEDTLEQVFGAEAAQTDTVHNIHLVIRDLSGQTATATARTGSHAAPVAPSQAHAQAQAPSQAQAAHQPQPPPPPPPPPSQIHQGHGGNTTITRVVVHGPAMGPAFAAGLPFPPHMLHPSFAPPGPPPHGLPQLDPRAQLSMLAATSAASRQQLDQILSDQPQALRDYAESLLSTGSPNVAVPADTRPDMLAHVHHHALVIRHSNESRRNMLAQHPHLDDASGSRSNSAQSSPSDRIPRRDAATVGPAHSNASRGLFHPLESMRRHQSDLDMLRLRVQRFLDSHGAGAEIAYDAASPVLENARNELTSLIFSRNYGQRTINSAIAHDGGRLPSHGTLTQEDIAVLNSFHAQFKQQAYAVERLLADLERRRGVSSGGAVGSPAPSGPNFATPQPDAVSQPTSSSPANNAFSLFPPDGSSPLVLSSAAGSGTDPQRSMVDVLNSEVARANQAVSAMNEQLARANRSLAAANSAVAAMNRAVTLTRPGSTTAAPRTSSRSHTRPDVRHEQEMRAAQELARIWAQRDGTAAGAAPAAQPVPEQPEDAALMRRDILTALVPLLRQLWLLVRIFGFILFFSGGGNLRRAFLIGIAAGLYLVLQADFMREIRNGAQRHFENLVGSYRRDGRGEAAAGADAGPAAQGANAAAGDQPAATTAADGLATSNTRINGLTPEAVAERLLQERRDRDRSWLRERLRGVERITALFVASLYPGMQVAAPPPAPQVMEVQAVEVVQDGQAGDRPPTDGTSQATGTAGDASNDHDDHDHDSSRPLFVPATKDQTPTAAAAAAAADNQNETLADANGGEGSSSAVETRNGEARHRPRAGSGVDAS